MASPLPEGSELDTSSSPSASAELTSAIAPPTTTTVAATTSELSSGLASDAPTSSLPSSSSSSTTNSLPSKAPYDPRPFALIRVDPKEPSTLYSSSSLGKLGRFLGRNLTGSPPSVNAFLPGGEPREGGERAARRGWVDLMPEDVGTSARRSQASENPFLLSSSTPAGNSSRQSQPSSSNSSRDHPVGRPTRPSVTTQPHSFVPDASNVSPSSASPATPKLPPTPPSSRRRPSWLKPIRQSSQSDSSTPTSTPGKWTFSLSTGLAKERPSYASLVASSQGRTLGKRVSIRDSMREPIEGRWTREGSCAVEEAGAPDVQEGERNEDEGYWEEEDGVPSFDIVSALPTEIALYIYLFLPASALTNCLSVCRDWNVLASDNLLWRSLFHSHEHWRIRSSYLSTLKPLPTPLPSPQPSRPSSPASIFQTLSISSHPPPPPTPSSDSINNLSSATLAPPLQTPVRRPNFESRVSILSTTTSISKMPLFSPTRPSSHLPYINWQTMYKKRAWLDARWGKEEFAKEQVFESHEDSVYCVQMDGEKLVTGSRDRSIKIWSLATGNCMQTVKDAHNASVLCLQFDEDTGFMITGGSDQKVIVWEEMGVGIPTKPLKRRTVLTGHTQGVLGVALSDRYIVSCSKDASILVHSRQTLDYLYTLSGHAGPVNAIGLQRPHLLASASGDGKIRLWDLETGRQVGSAFEGHERGLACISISGDLVVSGSNDKTVKLWNTSGECVKTLIGHTDLVRTLAFDAASGRILSAGYDKQMRIWSATGETISTLESGHTSLVFDVQFDAGRIVSASHDRTVRLHDFGDNSTRLMFC